MRNRFIDTLIDLLFATVVIIFSLVVGSLILKFSMCLFNPDNLFLIGILTIMGYLIRIAGVMFIMLALSFLIYYLIQRN